MLRLNRNEYFFHHAQTVSRLMADGDALEGRRYTAPEASHAFMTALSEVLGAQATLFHGAEDALLKILLWKAPEIARVIVPDFSWSNYVELAHGLSLRVDTFPVHARGHTFEHDLGALSERLAASEGPALVILASPNNPTGHVLCAHLLEDIVRKNPEHLFVLDAVYDAFPSTLAKLPTRLGNAFVLGSMSKFFGLPGLRLGYGVGAFPRAFNLTLGFNPYALRIAHAALEAREHYAANWETMRVQARLLKSSLDLKAGAGFTVCETHASFLLARLAQPLAPAALAALAMQSGALPKAFSHGAVRYLRWGLGPDLVRERIVRFMDLLAQRQDSDTQGHLAAKASSTSDSSN